MNKTAIKQHEIYTDMSDFSEKDLSVAASFLAFIRQQNELEEKKLLKMEGILQGRDVDLADLNKFRRTAG